MPQKIKDISVLAAGFQARKGVEPRPDGTHLLLQIRDFNEERTAVNIPGMVRVSPGAVDDSSCLQDGDIVFLAKGARKFAFPLQGLPDRTLAGGYFFVLRPSEEIFSPYLAWYLNQAPAQRHFRRFGTSGAHMPVVSRDVLGDLTIPVPDLNTQRTLMEIDELARHQQSLLAELSEKKRTLATAACLRLAEQSPSDPPNS